MATGEARCITKDSDFSMVEGTSLDPINLNKEFMQAVIEVDPEMAKDTTYARMQCAIGKKYNGMPLTVGEKAQFVGLGVAKSALTLVRPNLALFFGTMMKVMAGELLMTSVPIRVDGSVVGVVCFAHTVDSVAAKQDKARMEQVATTIGQVAVLAAAGSGDDE